MVAGHLQVRPMPALVLYQPDIPQNAGAILRLGACLGVPVHVIGPAGFDLSDRALRRAGLDYIGAAELVRHLSWPAFLAGRPPGRLVLMTTHGAEPHLGCAFHADDLILLGRESAGVPEVVHAAADLRLRIPMRPGMRSLNVGMAAAMAIGEALRQTGGFPKE
jgi:tRNA (cytidine/uridine-2'-O-)-methyltransferase